MLTIYPQTPGKLSFLNLQFVIVTGITSGFVNIFHIRYLMHIRSSLSVKALSHDETLHATLHATTELLRVTGFAGVACNVSCSIPKVERDPTSATLHASLQMSVTLIATFARSVACNRFIVCMARNGRSDDVTSGQFPYLFKASRALISIDFKGKHHN